MQKCLMKLCWMVQEAVYSCMQPLHVEWGLGIDMGAGRRVIESIQRPVATPD